MILHDIMVVCGMLIQSHRSPFPVAARRLPLGFFDRPIEVSSRSWWKLLTSEVLMPSMRSSAQFFLEGGPKGWYVWLYHAISCYIMLYPYMEVLLFWYPKSCKSLDYILYSILGLKAMVTTEDFGKPLSTLIWVSVFGLQFVRIELLITC